MKTPLVPLLSVALVIVSLSYIQPSTAVPLVTYDATSPYLQYEGRVMVSGSRVMYDWSGVTLSVWCTSCTTVSVTMNGGGASFKVYADGLVVGTLDTSPQDFLPYLLSGELIPGPHTLSLVRITEPDPSLTYSNLTLVVPTIVVNVQVDSSLALPPPLPSRRLELVVDASSDGYGVLSSNTSEGIIQCTFNQGSVEDVTMAYPFLLRDQFDVDLHLIAWSSKGLMVNADDTPSSTTPPLPAYFNRAISSEPNSWSFQWIPDAVILYLGANDYYGTANHPSSDQFTQRYLQFLQQVLTSYKGQTTIVAVCGGYDEYDQVPCPYIQKAVALLNVPNVQYLPIPSDLLSLESQMTCFDRPSMTGHQVYASYLGSALSRILGW